jgi:UDP-glucose 4-epimerase
MNKKNPTCIFLGANGYIGRHLCFYLDQMGWDIKACGKNESRHPSLPLTIPYFQLDITNKKNVEAIDWNVDYIFHFSGLTGTKVSFDQYDEFTLVNEIGLLNVLNVIKDLESKPRVIFPSSRLVYKGSKKLLKEEAEKESKTIYAANKLNCERFLHSYNSQYSIPFTIFRICVPYGNLLDESFSYGTIGFFLDRAKSGRTIELYGDGQQKRTFTHIESLCRQIADCSVKDEALNEIYNICGEKKSLKSCAKLIANKYKVSLEYLPWPKEDLKIESGDTVFNSIKIISLLNTSSIYTFEEWVKILPISPKRIN